jgi:hypothetical protein
LFEQPTARIAADVSQFTRPGAEPKAIRRDDGS